MDELDKGLQAALHGDQAEREAARVRCHVESWGLRLPEVTPLVLDFGLGEFQKTGEVEFWIANETAAGYCGKFLFVWGGQTCPAHMHREKLETFFIIRGRITMEHAGGLRTMAAGDVLRVEPGVLHRFTGLEPTLILEVSKPSILSDNYFEDSRIPIGGNADSSRKQG